MDPSVAHVSVKGQLTIPKAVRESLEIRTGDAVLFVEINNEVVLRKLSAIDAVWARGIQSTLGEWQDGFDDDL